MGGGDLKVRKLGCCPEALDPWPGKINLGGEEQYVVILGFKIWQLCHGPLCLIQTYKVPYSVYVCRVKSLPAQKSLCTI